MSKGKGRERWEKVKRGIRLVEADRSQEIPARKIDELVGEGHAVRDVWAFCRELNLEALYASIRSLEGQAGRPPYDPMMLFALWLYATLRGVSTAAELSRLCESDSAFQWLAGGHRPGAHVLSDFRVQHLELLRELLVQSVAVLRQAGMAVDLDEIAQDGVRVRASAGAASFRSAKTLQEQLEEARQLVKETSLSFDEDIRSSSRTQHAARKRAAQERLERVQSALAQLPEAQKLLEQDHHDDDDDDPSQVTTPPPLRRTKKKKKKRKLKRRSTTDPDARVMKMADGGFRPAFNIEYAVDTFSGVVVGVDVNQSSSDMGQMLPMYTRIINDFNVVPCEYLVDGGFAKHSDIEALEAQGTRVLATPKAPSDGSDPYQPRPNDSDAIAAWRQRMGTPEAQTLYKHRAASIELVNAQARNHGLVLLPVRGLLKVLSIALWHALTHNMTRLFACTPTPQHA